MKRLIIMDYLARGRGGHNQIYSTTIAREAEKLGVAAEIWCPTNCAIESKHAKKVFSGMKPFGRLQLFRQIFERAKEFRQLINKPDLAEGDVVFFHTVSHPFFVSISLALFGIKLKPKMVIMMRRGLNDKYRSNLPSFVSETVFWLMTAPFVLYLNRIENVIFATDSNLIADELSNFGLRGVFTLPIHHVSAKGIYNVHRTIIGYFGGGRKEKGFTMLPNIVSLVLKKKASSKFIIQTSIEKNYYFDSPALLNARSDLFKMAKEYKGSIDILDGAISYSAYEKAMEKCSIILLPYNADVYSQGTSGILAEAVAMGKWVVVPANTWMAAQKEKYDKISVFDNETPESIADAILKCKLLESKLDRARVDGQIKKWQAYHNPKNYMRILMEGAKS